MARIATNLIAALPSWCVPTGTSNVDVDTRPCMKAGVFPQSAGNLRNSSYYDGKKLSTKTFVVCGGDAPLRYAAWQTTDGTINATLPPEADIRFLDFHSRKRLFAARCATRTQYRSISGVIYSHARTYPAKNGQIRPRQMSGNDALQSHRKGGDLRLR